MVSLIKNQILKHLSRYTKNLSLDRINVSTFKGEGELTNLQLDEIVLTDLLELPLWLRLTSAVCNKVAFRVQWTKLKTVPIIISLDEVRVEVETCEELRSLSASQGLSSFGTNTKYKFMNKVVDGMTIIVNKVLIDFKSPAFTACVQIMRILVESKSPEWKAADLSQTRLKDPNKGQILIFKELEWQTLRLEASSQKDKKLPPLRLLTNKATCRLTIKKRMSDCFVMGCKLLLILEDLLWVLTDSQLKAVLHFIESLSGLVQKATEVTRITKAARKLELLPEYQAQRSQQERATDLNKMEQVFNKCDVVETSYHFWAQKIDLHLSDDPGDGRSCHHLLSKGSAVHMQVCSLQIDCYPYHLASGDRSHWARYNNVTSPHYHWLTTAQSVFNNSLLSLLDSNKHKTHGTAVDDKGKSFGSQLEESKINKPSPTVSEVKAYVLSQLGKVMTSCIVLRVEDFVVHRVSTNNRQSQKEFIKGDRSKHTYPIEVTLHAEFTYYYYPEDVPFPLPPPKFYVQINPVQVTFDLVTILWMNSFALNLHQSVLKNRKDSSPSANYVDVKVEAILPRVIFEGSSDSQGTQRDRPKSLHLQVSRALISNVRSAEVCSRADLAKCIHTSELGSLFYSSDFPSKPGDYHVITEKFSKHAQGEDNVQKPAKGLPSNNIEELKKALSRTLLWTEARDVWSVNLEPIWGEFYGARGVAHNQPIPFLDLFPVKVWVHADLKDSPSGKSYKSKPDLYALAYISNLISLQINHYQLLFLLRLADEFNELVTFLGLDSERIAKGGSGALVFGAVLPQLEVTLVMPSQSPGKESSGADIESVIPDTSSLADDVTNPSIQLNTTASCSLQDPEILRNKPSFFKCQKVCTSGDLCPEISTSGSHSGDEKVFFQTAVSSGSGALPTNFFKNFGNFKNTFSSFKGSQNMQEDNSDASYIKSDGSSDSDSCIMSATGFVNDAMFNVEGNEAPLVEFASEVTEEEDNHSAATFSVTTPSENPSNSSSFKRRDMIATATFKFGQVEVMQQSEGLKSNTKVQISNLAIDECSAIPWNEFQEKFNTRSRGWNEICEEPAERPRIRLRIEHSVEAHDTLFWSNPTIGSWFNDLLFLNLSNISLQMNPSIVAAVAEFFVDDVASPPLPMEVNLDNIEIFIIEESPKDMVPANTNPLKIVVSHSHISRNKEGIFIVEPLCREDSDVDSELTNLKIENEQLRRRLAAMERLNEENHYLRKCEEETHVLRSCLNEAQDSLNNLLLEKQNLLELIKGLQLSNKEGNSGKR